MRLMTGEEGTIELSAAEGNGDIFAEHYVIEVEQGRGSIRAARPRALLLGVYDFLRRCGCRFVRPGDKGEVIPKKNISEISVSADVTPDNRHRGVTIEGAVSLENVLGLVEWLPKAGFNSYFVQFRNAHEFFRRWYSHEGNDLLPPEPLLEEESAEFVGRIAEKLRERDMIYHAVGHGWTAACVGIAANGWKKVPDLPPEKADWLAQVNGKRGFFKNTPLNTHLCYSKTEVRRAMAEETVKYALAHPEVDVLHFWLADDSNNVCECAECRKKRLSDWYIMMLNEIDERLKAAGLKTKICFLVYLDLYWAPETERIHHPDRFLLMYAPIFRSYTKAAVCGGEKEADIPYVLNKVVYSDASAPYVRLLRDWKKVFSGDSFDFDYHLMWDINRDFGGETLARVLFEDIRSLPALSLNGLISCQLPRAFYPNGLAFYLMGRALSEPSLTLEEIRKEYYAAAFGKHAEFTRRFYEKTERLVSFPYMRDETDGASALPGLLEAKEFVRETLKNFPTESEDETRAESLAILKFTAENILHLTEVLTGILTGAPEEKVAAANEKRKRFFNQSELRFQPYADGFYVNMIVDGIVAMKKIGITPD